MFSIFWEVCLLFKSHIGLCGNLYLYMYTFISEDINCAITMLFILRLYYITQVWFYALLRMATFYTIVAGYSFCFEQ